MRRASPFAVSTQSTGSGSSSRTVTNIYGSGSDASSDAGGSRSSTYAAGGARGSGGEAGLSFWLAACYGNRGAGKAAPLDSNRNPYPTDSYADRAAPGAKS